MSNGPDSEWHGIFWVSSRDDFVRSQEETARSEFPNDAGSRVPKTGRVTRWSRRRPLARSGDLAGLGTVLLPTRGLKGVIKPFRTGGLWG